VDFAAFLLISIAAAQAVFVAPPVFDIGNDTAFAGAVACSPPSFEIGQVAFKGFLCAFQHQQELLCCFSVATAFLKLFEVLSLPVD
jgi:hypothetical protein